MEDPGNAFLRRSVEHLRDEYLPRLRAAVETLPEADLWWRPHAAANSAGNLLAHLAGNVRQWICCGLGGAADDRDRAREFARTGDATKAELCSSLEATVREACRVIEGLDPSRLLAPRRIQGFPVNGLTAVYHVVEHFAWHTGQIVYLAKMRAGAGHGLAFYDDDAVNRARNA